MRAAICWAGLLLVAGACSSHHRSAPPAPAAKPARAAPGSAAAPAPAGAAGSASDDGYDPAALGALSFPTTDGTPEARAHFTRGLLALHSFWYDEAQRQFDAAIEADPKMRMAYWGAAMSRIKLLWGDDDVDAARQLLQRMPDPGGLSPREQAWVAAANALLGPGGVLATRKAFVAAMEQVHQQFPDDESATFLSIALLSALRPGDPDARAVRLRAADLALKVFAHNPQHPGAAHYAIHALDTPELAPRALEVARAYAKIAPAAFHARHMPAHIFSRLGMWKEAIASCQAAWDASVAAAKREQLSQDHHDFHSLNWLVEMNFELGHRKQADQAMALFEQGVRDGLTHLERSQYAIQVASYLMRTEEWSRVDELLAPLDRPALDAGDDSPPALFEQLAATNARALAAAMQHDVPNTKRWLAAVEGLRAQMRPFLQASQPPAAVAKLEARADRNARILLARARGDDRALVAALRAAVPDADQEEQGGETLLRGSLVHEELADALLRLGQAKEATAEYARVLALHPHRAHALLGAARAALKAHDPATARARYGELVQLWETADPGTPGLDEAKTAITGQ